MQCCHVYFNYLQSSISNLVSSLTVPLKGRRFLVRAGRVSLKIISGVNPAESLGFQVNDVATAYNPRQFIEV